MAVSAEEAAAIREYRNAQNRAWWQAMTPEQRKEKRQQYDLNRMKRAQEREQEQAEHEGLKDE